MGRLLFIVALLACGARAAGAQAPGDSIRRDSTLRVFFDCPGFAAGCDFDFLRTEITWVDWVRDREDADVHALVTTQPTGGGGGRVYVDVDRIARLHREGRYPALLWGRDDHPGGSARLTLIGSVNLRLVKGLSLNVFGNVARIHDQLSLPKAGASDAEILLQRRELLTSYRYFTFVSLRYHFGSTLNNVVNPRFGGAGTFFCC